VRQKKLHSLIEALTNSFSGILTGYLSNVFILPLLTGHPVDWVTGWTITAVFTTISIVRSYIVRRIFNWLHWRV
jgi:hypothetical protein